MQIHVPLCPEKLGDLVKSQKLLSYKTGIKIPASENCGWNYAQKAFSTEPGTWRMFNKAQSFLAIEIMLFHQQGRSCSDQKGQHLPGDGVSPSTGPAFAVGTVIKVQETPACAISWAS